MGARLIAKGVDAEPDAIAYGAPVRRGLKGVFFHNTDLDKSKYNYAPGNKDVDTVIGTPTVSSSGYMSGKSGVNYIQTDIAETAEMTFFSVARALNIPATTPIAAADAPIISGNYSQSVPTGVVQWFNGPATFSGGAAYGPDASNTVNAGATIATDPTRWCLYSTTIKAAQVVVTNHTTGVTSTRNITTEGVRQVSSRKMRLGSSYQSTQQGTWDKMLEQIHDVALTDQEKADTVADLKAYVLRKTGIAV